MGQPLEHRGRHGALRSRLFIALAAGAVALAAPLAARAAEYVVSPSGNDSASGQSGAPWRTIQRAFTTVHGGDTVTVEDGTYAGIACDGVSGTASARVVIRARNRWGAKITSATPDSTQDWVQLASCSYVTIDGFEVSGAPRSGIAILGNNNDGSDARGVIIQNNYSHNNGGTSPTGRHDGIFSGFALDLTIQDNRIDMVGEHGIYVSNAADNPAILRNEISNTGNNCIQINADLSTGGDGLISNWRIEANRVRDCRGSAGVNLDGAVRGVLANNVIYNAAKGGITLFQGDGAQASNTNVIVNNTIYDPVGSRAGIQVADGANNNIIFNNIIISQSAGIEVQSATGLMHDYNLVSSYTGTTASAHESRPDAAALFMAPSTGDLRLLATATNAIDSGVAMFGGKAAPTTDVLGGARPTGSGYDIGAYEHGSTPTPPPPTGAGGAPGTGGATGGAGTGGATGGTGTGGRGGTSGTPGTGGRGGSAGTAGTGGATGTGGRDAGGVNGAGGAIGAGAGGATSAGGAIGAGAGGQQGPDGGVGQGPYGGGPGGCGCRSAASRSGAGLASLLLALACSLLVIRTRHDSP